MLDETSVAAVPQGSSVRHATNVTWMLGTSLAAHLAVGAGFFALANFSPPRNLPPQQVLMTQLVRLGTPRAKELLPRMPDPAAKPVQAAEVPPVPPPTPVPPSVAPSPPAAPQTAAAIPVPTLTPAAPVPKKPVAPRKATVSARDRIRAMGRMSHALERLKTAVDGQQDGSEQGDSDTAVLGNAYTTEVSRCLQAHYVIEGYNADKVSGLQAQVILHIDSEGRIIRYKLEKSSGLMAFDQAVGRAVSRCGKISPPPAALRNQVRKDGIEILFKP
jgi:TonB family protein